MRKNFTLSVALLLMVTLMFTLTSTAQDTEPTEIPVLPDATEDSAAPLAPEIAPPQVEDVEEADTETTEDPVATPVVADDNAGEDDPAPSGNICPIGVNDSFTAAEILCEDTGTGEACIGNGSVTTRFNGDVDGSFAQANDRAQISSLDRLELSSSGTWTVIRMAPELPTTDGGDLATATVFAFGNLNLTDTGEVAAGGPATGTILAGSGLNVRRAPGAEGVVVWQLSGGEEIIVTGVTADRQWVRIVIPNEFAGTGWIYSLYVDVPGGIEALPVVTVNSPQPDFSVPEFGPGESYELLSEVLPEDCDSDIPPSGLLVQSPNGTPDSLRFEINNAEIQVSGTIFVEALLGDVLRVSVLEGQGSVIANGSQTTANANNRINTSLDANLVVNGRPESEAFSASDLASIPTRILPRAISFGQETAVETGSVVPTAIPGSAADTTTEDTAGFGTPQPTEVSASTSCTLTAPGELRNIRTGASTDFDILRVLDADDSVEGVGQAIGELNLTWYQTADGGWLRIDTIDASAECGSLPVVETPDLPQPTATPETTASLGASTLAALTCDGSSTITGSAPSDGVDTSVAIGGLWGVTAGTTVTITTQGGMLRPEFGAYIKLISDDDGSEIASSGEQRTLTITFENDALFEARFSAANGDTVVMAASCQ